MSQDAISMVLDGIDVGSARGRKAMPLEVAFKRELTGADLDLILRPPELGSKTPFIQRIRHTHHALAQLIAHGKENAEIHLITGFSASRISILQNDPAFKELVAYYAGQREDVFVDAQKRLADLGISTLEELAERLETEPEKFNAKDLMELTKLCFDRSIAPSKSGPQGQSGNGPVAPVSIKINFVPGLQGVPALSAQSASPILEGVAIEVDEGAA